MVIIGMKRAPEYTQASQNRNDPAGRKKNNPIQTGKMTSTLKNIFVPIIFQFLKKYPAVIII
jgi:hypothetical protein